MNMMPSDPIRPNDPKTSTPPELSALAVAGRKAIRGSKRKGKPDLPAVKGVIDTWTDLSPSRRRDLRTAIAMLALAAGKELSTIAFTAANIRTILAATTPAACGLSDATFKAYRGWIGYALKRLGLMQERRLASAALMPAWAALLEQMTDDKGWIRLRAFVRHCSANGIAPGDADDGTLTAYFEHQRQGDIRGTARDTVRRVARAWNKAAGTVPGWPQTHLSPPASEPRQYSLPFSSYPPSLQADAKSFHDHLSGVSRKGLFQGDGPRRTLRPRTVLTRMTALQLALAGLVHSGFPRERVTSLAVLLERENLQALLDWHHARGGGKVGAHLGVIGATLAVLARHYVKLPPDQLGPVLEDLKLVRPPKQRFMTKKNELRLRQFDDPQNLADLLHLPNVLFAEAERIRDGTPERPGVAGCPPRPRQGAWLAAVALAIEIEFCCPLRLANLASLRLGVHLLCLGRDASRITHIMIDGDPAEGEGTKNHDPIRWPVSAPLAVALDRYLKGFHSLAVREAPSDWLFPHRDRPDVHRDPNGFAKAITDAIHRTAGVQVNVHLFRAFCGSLVLEENPEAIGDLQTILGHRTLEVSMIFYRSRRPDRAADRLAGVVERRRKETHHLAFGKRARSMIRRRGK